MAFQYLFLALCAGQLASQLASDTPLEGPTISTVSLVRTGSCESEGSSSLVTDVLDLNQLQLWSFIGSQSAGCSPSEVQLPLVPNQIHHNPAHSTHPHRFRCVQMQYFFFCILLQVPHTVVLVQREGTTQVYSTGMYTDMEEHINLVSPEAIPALYQYQAGIKVLYTSTQLVCEKGHAPVQHWYLLDVRSLKLWEECCFEINNYH